MPIDLNDLASVHRLILQALVDNWIAADREYVNAYYDLWQAEEELSRSEHYDLSYRRVCSAEQKVAAFAAAVTPGTRVDAQQHRAATRTLVTPLLAQYNADRRAFTDSQRSQRVWRDLSVDEHVGSWTVDWEQSWIAAP